MNLFLPLLGACWVAGPTQWRDPLDHEHRIGAFEIVPPIALPRPGPVSDVQVWVSVPDGRHIREEEGLRYPPGTVVDRVEFRLTKTGRRVVDVRGTSVDAEGDRWHHVYRPVSNRPDAPLLGASWPADDPVRTEEVLDQLMDALKRSGVKRIKAFRAKLDCESCHVLDRPASTRSREHGIVERGTDPFGFFTVRSLLSNSSVLERYGIDPNLSDPFVAIECPDGADLVLTPRAACASGATPVATRDVLAGWTGNDPHTNAFVKSRDRLRAHLAAPP